MKMVMILFFTGTFILNSLFAQTTVLNDISGMVKIATNVYLCVSDKKADSEPGAYLNTLFVSPKAISYESLNFSGWPKDVKHPSDLEAICKVPGTKFDYLLAESGYWKGEYGRIFYVKIEKAFDNWTMSYINHFYPFKKTEVNCDTINNTPTKYCTPDEDQIEGMFCLKYGENKLALFLGLRGSDKKNAAIVWGDLLLEDSLAFTPKQTLNLSSGYKKFGRRGIGDLFLPGPGPDNPNSGEIWSVATEDPGDNGPFSSVIYCIGKYTINDDDLRLDLDKSEILWRIDGHKVEAIAEASGAVSNSICSIGTDDEMYGGTWRSLAKSTLTTNDYFSMAVIWSQKSAEARALYYQAYNIARDVLDQDLKRSTTKKRAIVVDIDETVLDNSPYQAGQILNNENYPAGWKEWTKQASALALPGAVEFLNYAVKKGADVFYVSNRKIAETDGTLKNLQQAGFPQAQLSHLYLRDNESSKKSRRESIEKTHDIIILMGDNLNDFSHIFEKRSVDERFAEVDKNKDLFGKKFIVLPNPMYGDWEGAVYNYNWSSSDKEKDEIRKKALRIK